METRRVRLLEPPERALERMDQLCCFGVSRKTLYSSFGSVGISESSAETEAARIDFRMNSGKQVQTSSCLRWTVSCDLQPAGRGVHELPDCSPSCWLPSSGGWSSRWEEVVGQRYIAGGETQRIGEETAFSTRKLVDNFRGSADPHQVHGGIGGGLLGTLQECPEKLEGG